MPRFAGYELLKLLRRTPLFETWEIADAPSSRSALKRFAPEVSPTELQLRRFVEEGERTAALEHTGLVSVLAVESDEAGPRHLLEVVEGTDLFRLLEETKAPLPRTPALLVARSLAAALAFAHDHGLEHRFLGPRSVLLCPDGQVKLTDFRIGAEAGLPERDDVASLLDLVRALGVGTPELEAAAAGGVSRLLQVLSRELEAGERDPRASLSRLLSPGKIAPAETRPAQRPRRGIEPAETEREVLPGRALRAGDLLDGRYRILEPIGRGATGEVFRAEQIALARHVAIKIVRPELDAEERSRASERFLIEARIISELRHPNTVRLLDFGRTPDGGFYLATELLLGRTLAAAIRERPLDERSVVRVLRSVAGALREAHDRSVIHRDINPRNVFLVGPGVETIKVLDFGIAKLRGAPAHTAVGMTVGTPAYMAPEQAAGEVSPRSDLYALGVTAYECLTGQVPFSAANVQSLLLKHQHERPVPPAQRDPPVRVHPELERVVLRLLEKDPARRFEDAGALIEQLDHLERSMQRPRVPRVYVALASAGAAAVLALLVRAAVTRDVAPDGPVAAAPPLSTPDVTPRIEVRERAQPPDVPAQPVEREAPARPRRPPAPARAPDWRALDQQIERALAARKLELAELDAAQRWREVRARGDRAAAEDAAGALLEEIRTTELDRDLVKARLDRASRALKRAAGALSPEDARALDRRYFAIVSDFARAGDRASLERVADALRELEAALP